MSMLKRTVVYRFMWMVFAVWALAACHQKQPMKESGGGMWPLPMLDTQRVAELRAMGLRIPAEAINGIGEDGIHAAVIQFGSGCTGSFISPQGLLLTNYHCAYGAIQQLDNPERNIWANGYWAENLSDELPVSGLSVTVNKRVVDVTDRVLETDADPANQTRLQQRLQQIETDYRAQYPHCNVQVRSYKSQTVFHLYVQEQYHDVRLVGVLPKSVAKFGGETDNWMWPRHSADFAYFRVYADADGHPASYLSTNVPLANKHWLHLSMDGYEQGDLALVMGYPLQSDRKATSFQVWEKVNVLNPPMIQVRKQLLDILETEMTRNDSIRRMYSEKFSATANYYKNAVGMNHWVDTLAIVDKKARHEAQYLRWMERQGDTTIHREYARIEAGIKQNAPYQLAVSYYTEAFGLACDVIRFISAFGKAFEDIGHGLVTSSESKNMLRENIPLRYQNMHMDVDQRVTKEMLRLMHDRLPAEHLPDIFTEYGLTNDAAIDRYVDSVFASSVFADQARLLNWISNPDAPIETDLGYQLASSIQHKQQLLFKKMVDHDGTVKQAIRAFQTHAEAFLADTWHPDADGTIRVSYGRINGLKLGPHQNTYFTTLRGLIAKADSTDADFYLSPSLKSLWDQRDFGMYAVGGDMPVCFLAEGDVTGGNSGSPMLNADGEMIGLVFDVNWESMTREFNYEAGLHRVICVDIRYILWLTERLSGSRRIFQELEKANTAKDALPL